MSKRRTRQKNRPNRAARSGALAGISGQTFTAGQVAEILAASRRAGDGAQQPVAKAFGNAIPPDIRAAEQQQNMLPDSPFSPGEPVPPFDGYSRQPRTRDYRTGYNIATRPRVHERVSFDTLRGLINSYDIASSAIWHRIDSLRSTEYRFVAADNYSGDISGAAELATRIFRKLDGQHNFKTWFARWMYDVLAYDAGALYRLRNRRGDVIGLAPIDGTSVAPILDYWGNRPKAPAEAYVQYVQGLPWNWLSENDLIYEPFRAVNDSIYGRAPIESIVLNANTDMRFQLHFLERFTSGNVPEAFAAAPESWTPQQIEQFQDYWDDIMYGDQSRKHQVRWMPGGSSIMWSNEAEFTDQFSLFLMRKTLAAFHLVPTDLGFTDNANYSTGESQADVVHRVGELPLMQYTEDILSQFLQDDLQLPLAFTWDKGEDQDDRYTQAQADDVYIKNGTVATEEIREMRYGLPRSHRPVPRFIFSARGGPIPLNSLMAVAGEIDPETGAPAEGAQLPHTEFAPVEGTVPTPPPVGTPLAEEDYGPAALPPAPPAQPPSPDEPGQPVSKEAQGAGTEGITSDTGVYGYDGPGQRRRDEDDPEDDDRADAVAKELKAFRSFARGRRRAGQWRDFRFDRTDRVTAHNLNDTGRLAVRKAAGEIAVAGLAVQAADTGRVLMLQRALDDDDPAAGKLEFPGGHLEDDESPLAGAWREWGEECGVAPPPGVKTGTWIAGDGIYQGIVWECETEAMVPVRCDTQISNPDDPDGDSMEAIMWVEPCDLPGNTMVRPELAASLDDVLPLLVPEDDPDDPVDDEVAKAAKSGPKALALTGATGRAGS